GASTEDQVVARDAMYRQLRRVLRPAFVVRVVHDVAHLVPAAVKWPETPDLATGTDIGAVIVGRGKVRVVEGVLGAVVAADVAFTDQPAGAARHPVDVAV